MSWASETLRQLETKGRENWSVDDYESYSYIMCVNAESAWEDAVDSWEGDFHPEDHTPFEW